MRTNLIQCRQELGLTQEQVARKVGITLRTYAHFERGTTKGSCETWLAIEDVFGISMRELRKNFDENGIEIKTDRTDKVSQTDSVQSET